MTRPPAPSSTGTEWTPRNEQGFTLIELSVTLLVFGILMTLVGTSFLNLQQGVSDNFVRQAEVQDAQGAVQVISRDVRAIADDQALQLPLITTMNPATLVASVNVDTTVNPAAPGNASAYSGCPDKVTIQGVAISDTTGGGPITETRTTPTVSGNACTWVPTAANTSTNTIASSAQLGLAYLTASGAVSALGSTTASVQITVVATPSGPARTDIRETIVEATPLATYSGVQASGAL